MTLSFPLLVDGCQEHAGLGRQHSLVLIDVCLLLPSSASVFVKLKVEGGLGGGGDEKGSCIGD